MLLIRNDIPPKLASTDDKPIESFYVDLNFRNKKWLLNCSYNPKYNSIKLHLACFYISVNSLSSKYDNVILLSDLTYALRILLWKYFVKLTNYKIL